jgi:hypothetical protein
MVKREGVLKYLVQGWSEKRMRRLAKFRLDNEMKEGKYWMSEEDRNYRLCGLEKETCEHV